MNIEILHNARLYTMDAARPAASAIAIGRLPAQRAHGGVILKVGSDAEVLSTIAEASKIRDLRGHTIIPGLTDSHIHLEQLAHSRQIIDCETADRETCLARVAERAQGTSPGDWILGHGWSQAEWPEGLGSAELLDAVAPQNPVFLTAKSLHAAWVNSAALQAAEISVHTVDPPGGFIQRDASQRPTGILFEAAAGLVSKVIPHRSVDQIAAAIRDVLPSLWRLGLTGAHDFDRSRCFQALQILHQRGELGLRVIKSIPVEELSSAVAIGLRTGYGDDLLRIGSIKAFADGALGPRTAAMFQAYESEPENHGILLLDREEIFEQGQEAIANGLSLAIHAIGDRANHEALAAYAQIRAYEMERGLAPFRHRIEHVQILHPDDFERLARMDVIASMQPIHATSDMIAANRYWGGRAINAYAWRKLLEHGARLAFGSDAPVDSPNPFWGLHAAVTRQRADGSPGSNGWYPDQRLDLSTALKGYTLGAAYAGGQERYLGQLRTGFLADLVILDKDPFECEPGAIRELKALATMIGGEWVLDEFFDM